MAAEQIPAGSIVVGIDGSSWADEAFAWAVEQAALEQRSLTVVHCVEPVGYPSVGTMGAATGLDYGMFLDQSMKAARALLNNATERALQDHPQLAVHQVLSHADPRNCLLDLSEAAAMIVVGSRGRGPVASLLLGSVSVSLSKHAACPIVVHRPHRADTPRYGILVGVDGTERSVPAIDFAYRMASIRGMPLTVLHCYWDVTQTAHVETTSQPDTTSERALVSESLAGMQERFPEVKVEVRLTVGFADKHLITASGNYDLLVIGHHPIPALNDIFYGSVAPTVIEHAHGTVAVVPSSVVVASAGEVAM